MLAMIYQLTLTTCDFASSDSAKSFYAIPKLLRGDLSFIATYIV